MADDDEHHSLDDDFIRWIGMALSPYQLIEEYLKWYIEDAHVKIQSILVGRIPFRFPRKEYENAPLERLITMFGRHCDNDDLIKRLRSALTKRNYVAHKAFAHYQQHRHGDRDPTKLLWEIKGIEEEGYELVNQLEKEIAKLESVTCR